jgi:hypothetical protein
MPNPTLLELLARYAAQQKAAAPADATAAPRRLAPPPLAGGERAPDVPAPFGAQPALPIVPATYLDTLTALAGRPAHTAARAMDAGGAADDPDWEQIAQYFPKGDSVVVDPSRADPNQGAGRFTWAHEMAHRLDPISLDRAYLVRHGLAAASPDPALADAFNAWMHHHPDRRPAADSYGATAPREGFADALASAVRHLQATAGGGPATSAALDRAATLPEGTTPPPATDTLVTELLKRAVYANHPLRGRR